MTARFSAPGVSRRQLLKLAGAAGLFAAVGMSATACAGPTGLPGKDTLTLALNRSLVSLDNKLNQFDAAVTVQRSVREGLTAIGPDIAPIPMLAESMVMASPTRWTVKLREGITYSDGRPVKPQDVATALEMYAKVQGSFVASFFPEFPSVTEVDERTFHLDSKGPIPILDALMALILISPAEDNKAEELQTGVGTGPYVVQSFDRGAGTYTLVRNEKYWGEPAPIRQVNVRFLPEESSRVIALRSGEVDVIDSISPNSMEQLQGLPGVTIDTASSLRLNQIFYNFRKPATHPLSDAKVRQALSFAIDGKALVHDVLIDTVEQAQGVTPTSLSGYAKTGDYVYDPGKAKSLLSDLGAENLKLKIIWETGEFPSDTAIMEALVQMMGDIGVKTELQQFEPGGNILQWRQGKEGDWDLLGNGFSSPTGLAITMLQGMYAGTAEKEKTRDTYQGYINSDVERKIARAASEVDEAKRTAYLKVAQQAVWDTWPCAWAFTPKSILARRNRVQNLELSAANAYPLARVGLES